MTEEKPLTHAEKVKAGIARKREALLRKNQIENEVLAKSFDPVPEVPHERPLPQPVGFPRIDDMERVYGRLTFAADGTIDERRTRQMRTFARLPFPLRLAWDTTKVIHRVVCHRRVARHVEEIFREIGMNSTDEQRRATGGDLFGGSFFFDLIDRRPSPSCWAACVVINPTKVPPDYVVEAFTSRGWTLEGSTFYAATF